MAILFPVPLNALEWCYVSIAVIAVDYVAILTASWCCASCQLSDGHCFK